MRKVIGTWSTGDLDMRWDSAKLIGRFGGSEIPDGLLNKIPGGVLAHARVPRLDKNLWAAQVKYRFSALQFQPLPCGSFKSYRRNPEYKPCMYLGLHHRAGPTLNARASALRDNIPPKAAKTSGERQGSREAISANYPQETGLSRKHRHSLG